MKTEKSYGDLRLLTGAVLDVQLWYPGCGPESDRGVDHPVEVQVGLTHVRAADDIRISYDFERDGYIVRQASKFSWGDEDDGTCDPDWQEVAFIKAWQREVPDAWE